MAITFSLFSTLACLAALPDGDNPSTSTSSPYTAHTIAAWFHLAQPRRNEARIMARATSNIWFPFAHVPARTCQHSFAHQLAISVACHSSQSALLSKPAKFNRLDKTVSHAKAAQPFTLNLFDPALCKLDLLAKHHSSLEYCARFADAQAASTSSFTPLLCGCQRLPDHARSPAHHKLPRRVADGSEEFIRRQVFVNCKYHNVVGVAA